MEENNKNDSVYELVTKLCERIIINEKKSVSKAVVHKMRSSAYELLLKKKLPTTQSISCLENNTDPYCQLIAWEYMLTNVYNQSEVAKKIEKCVESLQNLSTLNKITLDNMIIFLLELKQIPIYNEGIIDHNILHKNGLMFRSFNANQFKLPDACICLNKRFSNNSFIHQPKRSIKKFIEPLRGHASSMSFFDCCSLLSCKFSTPQTSQNTFFESNSFDVLSTEEIWKIASNTEYTNRRTWESFGDPTPVKDTPFLSESNPETCALINEMQNNINYTLIQDMFIPTKYLTQSEFNKDVKNILVGIVSKTFNYNKAGCVCLMPGFTIKGFTHEALTSYCKDIIFCGDCYKALNNMSTMDLCTGKYKQDGYIFAELCESISRYLSFYRISAHLPSENLGVIDLHNHMLKLRAPLRALAAICKVGPFAKCELIPHGVALINYLYEQVQTFSNKDIYMVLYSVLYPCLQVYFCRFLRQWILEGVVSDPYNEFFIESNTKYLATRGRTYWTRGYTVNDDIVPIFLDNLRTEIFNCGRTMNLLKLCFPKSPICVYFMGTKPNILQCCLTSEQLKKLEENVACYYLEAIAASGPRFSLKNIIKRRRDQEHIFFNLIDNKRAITLKRIKLEKMKEMEILSEKKNAEIQICRDQYDLAIKQKVAVRVAEINEETKFTENQIKMKILEEKIIKEEAADMINYYSKLFKETDKRQIAIEKHIEKTKNLHLDTSQSPNESITLTNTSNTSIKNIDVCLSTESLENDILNANINQNSNIYNQATENFAIARKNRARVLNLEMGIVLNEPPELSTDLIRSDEVIDLTEAQRNKLRVMSTEYNIELPAKKLINRPLSDAEINRNKNMATNKVFYGIKCDNDMYINKNAYGDFINLDKEKDYINDNYIEDATHLLQVNSKNLSLDFDKIPKYNLKRSYSSFVNFLKSPNFEFQKPMSVDSTPLHEFSPLSKMPFATPSTAATNFSDDGGFDFIKCINLPSSIDTNISKRLTSEDVKNVSINCLNYFLQQSIIMPVLTQINLMQSEMLKYFINDLAYLQHLNSLRNYFFLQDGEFARNITEGLFEKLYDADAPIDLINFRTLRQLVYTAVDSSCKFSENTEFLSFKINKLPKLFDLGDPAVLDCLSLSYKVAWPLNILLPSDTIAKYDDVFKFLLKLHRVSWILKKIFLELKMLAKQTGKRETFLMLSPQYQKLHLSRHIMMHFIQTLQNYVVGEVLQTSWVNFEENLEAVKNIDQLYNLHTTYIKNILFMCLLNQRSAPIRKVINNIFVVILKFYNYLRSRQWEFDDDAFIHPNFNKLDSIFNNFIEFVQFLFKAGHKVAKTGYQPQLVQLVDMLDINDFFSNRLIKIKAQSKN